MNDCLLCADEPECEPECTRSTDEGRAQHARISALMREAKHAPWSTLVFRDDPSLGERWFLDDQPIHCGAGLELQQLEYVMDDGDEFALPVQLSVRGRFEIAWTTKGKVPMFHTSIGCYDFAKAIDIGMRFRWPERRR